MEKRILMSLLMIGVAVIVAIGGTVAYFSDTETSTGNTFTAGTLNLNLTDASENGTESETATWVFGNIAPGGSGGAILTVQNTGSINGYLDLSSISATNVEGTNPESETSSGTVLSDKLLVYMFWDVNGNGVYDAGDTYVYGTAGTPLALSGISSSYNSNYAIVGPSTTYLSMNWTWTSTATDNDVQGDITTLTFTVELDQIVD